MQQAAIVVKWLKVTDVKRQCIRFIDNMLSVYVASLNMKNTLNVKTTLNLKIISAKSEKAEN